VSDCCTPWMVEKLLYSEVNQLGLKMNHCVKCRWDVLGRITRSYLALLT
jgi:hypothetical protein